MRGRAVEELVAGSTTAMVSVMMLLVEDMVTVCVGNAIDVRQDVKTRGILCISNRMTYALTKLEH